VNATPVGVHDPGSTLNVPPTTEAPATVTVPAATCGWMTVAVGEEVRVCGVKPAVWPVAETVICAPSWADVSVRDDVVAPAIATFPASHCHVTESVTGVHGGSEAVSVVPTTAEPEIVGAGVLVNVPSIVVKFQLSAVSTELPTRSVTAVEIPTAYTVSGASGAAGVRVTVDPLTVRVAVTSEGAPLVYSRTEAAVTLAGSTFSVKVIVTPVFRATSVAPGAGVLPVITGAVWSERTE
jgi:hypothetical protein